jgi:hypothetical protein
MMKAFMYVDWRFPQRQPPSMLRGHPPTIQLAVCFNAADKTLTVVVDFDQALITLFAATYGVARGLV